jgi:hypothetical protein
MREPGKRVVVGATISFDEDVLKASVSYGFGRVAISK